MPADSVETHDDELRRLLAGLQLLGNEAVAQRDAVLRPVRSGRRAPPGELAAGAELDAAADELGVGESEVLAAGAELDTSDVGGAGRDEAGDGLIGRLGAGTARRQQGQTDNRDRKFPAWSEPHTSSVTTSLACAPGARKHRNAQFPGQYCPPFAVRTR